MTLLELRTQLIEVSGRYDLVVDAITFVDNGANFYINSAIKMLDRLLGLPATKAKLYFPLAAGEYAITFQHSCRVIEQVWINDNTSRTQLGKISLGDLKYLYNGLASAADQGTPIVYALTELRALETTARDSLGTFINKTWDETDTKYDYRGIVIAPPADTNFVVEIDGFFKSATLSSDSDENYWTLEEEDLLLRTAMYKLEAFSRGTENAKNWLSAIVADVHEIGKDIAQEESTDITQTEG